MFDLRLPKFFENWVVGQFGAMQGVGSLFRSGNTLIFVDSQPKKTPDPLAHTQMRQTDPLPKID